MNIDVSPRTIAQTASNTLRRAMLHSSWTLLGMGDSGIDCCNCKGCPAHRFGFVMICNTVTACHQRALRPLSPGLLPLVGVACMTVCVAIEPTNDRVRQYSRITIGTPANAKPFKCSALRLYVRASLVGSPDGLWCLPDVDIATPLTVRLFAVWAVTTHRHIITG